MVDITPNPPIGISTKGCWHQFKDYLVVRRRLVNIDPAKNIKKFYEIRVYQSYPIYKNIKQDSVGILNGTAKAVMPPVIVPTHYVVETTYGRIGTTGKIDDGGIPFEDMAKYVQDTINAKIKKGYVEEV